MDILLGVAGHQPPSRKGSGSSQPVSYNPDEVKLPDSVSEILSLGVDSEEGWDYADFELIL